MGLRRCLSQGPRELTLVCNLGVSVGSDDEDSRYRSKLALQPSTEEEVEPPYLWSLIYLLSAHLPVTYIVDRKYFGVSAISRVGIRQSAWVRPKWLEENDNIRWCDNEMVAVICLVKFCGPGMEFSFSSSVLDSHDFIAVH